MQHLGGAEGLGMDAAGFLELERDLLGDAEGEAAADHIEAAGLAPGQEGRRPVAALRPRRVPRAPAPARRPEASSCAHSAVRCRKARQVARKLLVAATLRSRPPPAAARARRPWRRAASVSSLTKPITNARRRAFAASVSSSASGTAAGLRGGDEHGTGEVELAAIDRGEARAERGDGQAERALDQVFAIGRGMVGGAARAGRDEGRSLDAQALDEIGDGRAVLRASWRRATTAASAASRVSWASAMAAQRGLRAVGRRCGSRGCGSSLLSGAADTLDRERTTGDAFGEGAFGGASRRSQAARKPALKASPGAGGVEHGLGMARQGAMTL
jgi:hypothetical protein